MFNIGDRVVYPMHGAGIIEAIEEKEILGNRRKYYVMNLTIGDMKVMIPMDNANNIGLRQIISKKEIMNVLSTLKEPCGDFSPNWNRRYMINLEKIKSGEINEVAEVVKNLFHREKEKGLSTGEKKMFESAKRILVSEITLVEDIEPSKAVGMIEEIFS